MVAVEQTQLNHVRLSMLHLSEAWLLFAAGMTIASFAFILERFFKNRPFDTQYYRVYISKSIDSVCSKKSYVYHF